MNNLKLQSIGVLVRIGCLIVFLLAPVQAAEKLCKILIKAASSESGGQQFVDPGLEDTVKDLKRRAGSFDVVDDEASAELLMLVVSRDDTPVSGQRTAKRVTVTLSVKDGTSWKPGAKISKVSQSWGLSSLNVIGEAKKWVKANAGK